MRSVSVRLADLCKITIPIGFVGENLHTQVKIDCMKSFEEYPDALVALSVKPAEGDAYPAVVTREGNFIIWDITDSDLVHQGVGEFQLSFIVDQIVAKSYIGKIRVDRSIMPTGNIPDPVENWIGQATALLEEIEDAFPEGGTKGQVLAKASENDFDTEWVDLIDDNAGAGDTDKTWSADKLANEFNNLPDPQDIIDDTAGEGDTDKVWSADKLTSEIDGKANKENTRITGSLAFDGVQNVATGRSSVAFGEVNKASGNGAMATGTLSEANGSYSLANGRKTIAIGSGSHSEGQDTIAIGNASYTAGHGTVGTWSWQHVLGEYNIPDKLQYSTEWAFFTNYEVGDPVYRTVSGTTKYYVCINKHTSGSTFNADYWAECNPSTPNTYFVEIVGNGFSNTLRSNARTLDRNGNERLHGDLYVGCNDDSSGGTKVAKVTELQDMYKKIELMESYIPDTVQTITFDQQTGNISQILHSRNNVAVRTDVFTFGSNSVTEVRTLDTGESLTIDTNTATLVTTVTYTTV